MNLISIDNVTKAYTDKVLLQETSFYLNEGEKVGIIGINGTGKSTLLKIIAGMEEPDSGSVTRASHVVVNFLSQTPVFHTGDTVLEAVMRGHVEKGTQWNLETEAKSMLTRLGVNDFTEKCEQLSGGQRKRLALVSALLFPADVLILDEPTNHLDHEMADWLEERLKSFRGALVMVTHDRYFLDSVSNRIIEIDHGKIYSYQTNYSGFLQAKAERQDIEQASERKRQTILRTELEWMQRGARARSTKQKAHIARYEELRDKEAPAQDSKMEMGSISSRLGKTTVEISHMSKGYGDKKLIEDFSYIFLKEDRVGFVGKNGCGKTTLMKILTGQVQPDQGEIIIGQTVKIGYYAQEIGVLQQGLDENAIQSARETAAMDNNQRVIDYIKDVAEYVQTADGMVTASKMLERFLFEGSIQYSQIGKLSGGEKRRLNLLRVLMGAPNVLILDEPTNDLDIETLTILEDYLDHFDGIVILVSHDRYFLDRVARRIFAFEGNGVLKQYEGGYTDYHNRRQEEQSDTEGGAGMKAGLTGKAAAGAAEQSTVKKSWKNSAPRKLKFTFQEQKDYESIEEELAQIESRLEELEQELLANAKDFVRLNDITKEKEDLEQRQEEKMERWMYLEDLAERIKNGEMSDEA